MRLYVEGQSSFRKAFSTAVLITLLPLLGSGLFSIYKYTNSEEFQSSQRFKKALKTEVDHQRMLTENEIQFLYDLGFKDSIDYTAVRIHSSDTTDQHMDDFGAMAQVEGSYLAVHSGKYDDDYADLDTTHDNRLMFIHELTHVWQQQNCAPNTGRGRLVRFLENFRSQVLRLDPTSDMLAEKMSEYSYELSYDSDLMDFNHEAQATIMEDFYNFSMHGYTSVYMTNAQGQKPEDIRIQYENTLTNFYANPHYAKPRVCLPF